MQQLTHGDASMLHTVFYFVPYYDLQNFRSVCKIFDKQILQMPQLYAQCTVRSQLNAMHMCALQESFKKYLQIVRIYHAHFLASLIVPKFASTIVELILLFETELQDSVYAMDMPALERLQVEQLHSGLVTWMNEKMPKLQYLVLEHTTSLKMLQAAKPALTRLKNLHMQGVKLNANEMMPLLQNQNLASKIVELHGLGCNSAYIPVISLLLQVRSLQITFRSSSNSDLLAKAMAQLKHLTFLSLTNLIDSSCNFNSMFESITPELTTLHISIAITRFPAISHLEKLSELSFQDCKFDIIPDWFTDLTSIQSLLWIPKHRMRLTCDLPPHTVQLSVTNIYFDSSIFNQDSRITTMVLQNCALHMWDSVKMKKVGESLRSLSLQNSKADMWKLECFPHLQQLCIRNQPDFYFSPFISFSKTLQELSLQKCGLMEFPETALYCVSLKVLNIQDNFIATIPEGLFSKNKAKLERLNAEQNMLQCLPSFAQYPSMKYFLWCLNSFSDRNSKLSTYYQYITQFNGVPTQAIASACLQFYNDSDKMESANILSIKSIAQLHECFIVHSLITSCARAIIHPSDCSQYYFYLKQTTPLQVYKQIEISEPCCVASSYKWYQ